MDILSRPIDDLHLPKRVENALKRDDSWDGRITTIGKLVDHSSDEILNRIHCGPRSVAIISEALEKVGLSLKSVIEPYVPMTTEAVQQRCETCRFWEPSEDMPETFGVCRRMPPQQDVLATIKIALNLRDFMRANEDKNERYEYDSEVGAPYESIDDSEIHPGAVFPETMRDTWCGEWQKGSRS